MTTPLLMLLVLLITQFALALHAQHVAQTAATQGLAALRVVGGSTAAGKEEAVDVLSQLGSGPLKEPTVSLSRTASMSTVDVRGEVVSIVPFLHLTVSGRAVGVTERFQPAGQER